MDLHILLQNKFNESKQRNQSLSLRGFSKRINMDPTTISRFLNGKRKISYKMAKKLCDKLGLDPFIRNKILRNYETQKKGELKKDKLSLDYVEMELGHFKVISEWQYLAILSLIKCDNFKPQMNHIAQRLGISKKKAQESLNRLINLGYIEVKNKKLKRKYPRLKTSDNLINPALRKAQHTNLQIAGESLDNVSLDKRDLTAITMSIDIDKIEEAKIRIRQFQDELSLFLESDKKNEVYKLAIQLFPLTKLEENT